MKWEYRGASQKIWLLLCVVIRLWGHQRWSSEFRLVHCHVNWYGRDMCKSQSTSLISPLLSTSRIVSKVVICWAQHGFFHSTGSTNCCCDAAFGLLFTHFTPLSWRCRRINLGFNWTLYRFLQECMRSMLAFLVLFLKEFLQCIAYHGGVSNLNGHWMKYRFDCDFFSRKASLHTPSLFCRESKWVYPASKSR